MVDLDTRPDRTDRTTRSAALWATAVAVPVAALAGLVIFFQVAPEEPAPGPTRAVPVPSTPVAMDAPSLPARAATVCRAVTSQLPAAVRDLPARAVTAGPEQNAAYGEPPLTVACGVPQPEMCATPAAAGGCVPLDAELLNMDYVCWYAEKGTAANTFTTMDREIPVRVTVPASYDKAAQWANEFSATLVKTVKSKTAGVPSGCV